MLLLGIDIGTSFIKVSVADVSSQQCIVSVQYPETESSIISLQTGWAEQSPGMWWENTKQAILKANATKKYNPKDIAAIGISYQMHGLVLIDKAQNILRDSIIWCDSRAVSIGEKAFHGIGEEKCLSQLLNSPGNFTASKLKWVKENEPELYEKIDKVLLPGDFISMKFTGEISTSISALSEGIFWDFKHQELSKDILNYYEFDESFFPNIQDVFSVHGHLTKEIADALSLKENTPVTYKAGDQPNNALSLNVLQPGEVAATAGTSGVIYGVSDRLTYDHESRVNSFAHVNHSNKKNSIGVLLCINGTGILNRWVKNIVGENFSYQEMNEAATKIKPGSDGLMILPFGNGAERMLNNKTVGAQIDHIDLNKHSAAHIYRAAQEGIAFAFRYGLDIMRENKMHPGIVRAGKANMFLSDVFTQAFVNATSVAVELYNCDGSEGAALGAGIGSKIFTDAKEAFVNFKALQTIEPNNAEAYEELYQRWKKIVEKQIHS
jgi:xylulokinase